ncbi:enoyl-CoA hydratase-related protein [Streptomyces sp. NPDC002577]
MAVRLEVDDHVAVLTLDDAGRRNAVTADLSRAVRTAVAQIRGRPEVRAVVLTGAGPAFSAGGDVDSLAARSEPLSVFSEGVAALAELTIPTVAAVNGPAVGAGMNWALACDVIIAARSARFDPCFLDIGIHPGGGHLWRLQNLVGRQATAAMVLFGETLDGEQAAALGLAWQVVDDDQLMPAALRLARRAAGRSGELVRRTKETLAVSTTLTDARAALDLETDAQRWSMDRPAFAEGVARLRRRLHKESRKTAQT